MSPNKNFIDQAENPTDAGDNPMAEGEVGNQLSLSTSEYPELEGLKDSPVEVRCKGRATDENGQVTIVIDGQCEVSTEGQADKAMKSMSEQSYNEPESGGSNESDF